MKIAFKTDRLCLSVVALCAITSCCTKGTISEHAGHADEADAIPLKVVDLARKIAGEPWPLNQSKLSTDLGIQFNHSKQLSTNLQIYRSDPIKAADGYDVEYVEYRALTQKNDDPVLYVVLALNMNRCYSMDEARKALNANTKKNWIPSHNAPSQKPTSIYVRKVEGGELMLTSGNGNPQCLSTIARRKTQNLPFPPIRRTTAK